MPSITTHRIIKNEREHTHRQRKIALSVNDLSYPTTNSEGGVC